ncbi:MAG TPA: methionine aminopeptidase [Lachnospiraceae bacterium]|jgi:methionyl aminopeptidase|nr:methionine aminopeptidase [Lachnospiraceae bacterium]
MKLEPNDPCWCGSGRKYKKCHMQQDEKVQIYKDKGIIVPSHKLLKTPEQLAGIRESAKVNVAVLDEVSKRIHEGMSTEDINDIVNEVTYGMDAIPAPLNYEGFPKSVCTSINNVVCHGIPSKDEILVDGDIINVDVSTVKNGYYSDSSRMFLIGDVDPAWKKLVEDTKKAVELALAEVKPWGMLGDVGAVVNEFAKKQGYSVVREIGGHGCGVEFHEDPWVGFTTRRGTGMLLVPGLTFTIEPMINLGTADIYQDEDNGWTIYTDDDQPSAQWEIQVTVTEDGHEVLTW